MGGKWGFILEVEGSRHPFLGNFGLRISPTTSPTM